MGSFKLMMNTTWEASPTGNKPTLNKHLFTYTPKGSICYAVW